MSDTKDLQDRNAVVVEFLNLLIPTRDGEGRGITPGIVVESEEVAANGVRAAIHVVGHLIAVRFDISGGVTDGDAAKTASIDVRLDVTGDSLDVGSGGGGSIIVDDLVGGEKEQCVVVLGKHLDGGEDALEVDLVVRCLRGGSVDAVLGGVDIKSEVDASSRKGVHAGIVVGRVVNGVDTDRVDAELLEVLDVTLAASGIGNGIFGCGGATGLVVNTADVETRIASEES